MWQSFAAGAAWGLALVRGHGGVTECHCTCKCELPDLAGGWAWEIIKACGWILIGVLLQLFQAVPLLLRRIWPVIFGGDHGEKGAVPAFRIEESEVGLEVEQRARDQIQALRARK